jgi:undecaprenyl-diphosphatase
MTRRWLIPLSALVILGGLVRFGALAPIDQEVFEAVRTQSPTPIHAVANVVTVIGQTDVDVIVALALSLFFLLKRHEGWTAWAPLVLVIAAIGLELASKGLVGHVRPPREFVHETKVLPTLLGLAQGVTVGPGFPSGHVLRAAVLGLLLARRWPSLGPLLIVLVILVALTRIVLGVHWLSDTLGSIAAALFLVNAWDAFVRSRQGADPHPIAEQTVE